MKGIFCSIGDVGAAGLDQIPLMCALSDNVVIWTPSGTLLDRWYNADTNRLSKRQIVNLVSEGHVRLAFREEWLQPDLREARHKADGRFAKFDAYLEGEVASDDSLRKSDKIIVLKDFPQFYNEAEHIVKNRDVEFERVKFFFERNRFNLPKASNERIDTRLANRRKLIGTNYSESDVAIEQLYRDARLLSALQDRFNTDTPFQLDRMDVFTYSSCYDQPAYIPTHQSTDTAIDVIQDVIRRLQSIAPTNMSQFERIQSIKEDTVILEYFRATVDGSARSMLAALQMEYDRAAKRDISYSDAMIRSAGGKIGALALMLSIFSNVMAGIDIPNDIYSKDSIVWASEKLDFLISLYLFFRDYFGLIDPKLISSDEANLAIISIIAGKPHDRRLLDVIPKLA